MKVLLVCLAALAAVCARTTTRQQAITPHITSLTDKDARQKARVHPAFASAGQRTGIELWRIKDFEPVPVPEKEIGTFYKGDSYIVLKTTSDKRNNLAWDIHYWIGSESSQDEAGAAAILTVGLDDKFDGKAVQHRETMGYESSQFLNYFKNGAVRYLDGGNASGFKHVTTNAGAEKRLFQVKGKRNVRVRQVDPLISSMNKGDCFILDIDQDIYVYVGEKARNVEKLKAKAVADQIRDQDHHGRGRVEIIDQYSSEVDTQKFFTALGSGNRDLVPEDSAGGDDQTFEKSEEQVPILSEVSDSSGKLKVTPLSRPFRQEQLKPQETYILDTVSGSIYVWVGKQATQSEKNEAMNKAQQYLSSKNYPSWVHIAKIPQGTEPAIFKQYFSTWRDVGMSHSRVVRSVEDQKDTNFEWRLQSLNVPETKLYEVVALSPSNVYFKPILDFKQMDLEEDGVYFLEKEDEIIAWIGKEAPLHKVKATPIYLDNYSRGQNKRVTLMKQGLETPAFSRSFRKWDPDMWIKVNTYEMERERVLRNNEIDDN
ncbi:gelsolin-like [Aricia agestis]|uniref:gelsolin-like n=1 Tax=Aricia agestis TaxID=91739 RepID=UPI001C203AD1|nr:gelsolin-like [Aricia agestis]